MGKFAITSAREREARNEKKVLLASRNPLEFYVAVSSLIFSFPH
jgi:hypothetical protein